MLVWSWKGRKEIKGINKYMAFDNNLAIILNISFHILTLTVSVFTILGIIKLVIFNRRIEQIKRKYFDVLVDNVIVVRIEYFRLMEDINFLSKFKESIPKLLTTNNKVAVQNDYDELEGIIFKKKRTVRKFTFSLAMIALALIGTVFGFLLKDFIFFGHGYYIFLVFMIVALTIGLFIIKFII